ncbi:type II/IV secretion system protein [candidate division KSB3 bacterium]|uniref:Type II/IV secretion system protein n=1 Tax=candidate division KSB3 bacterium TaxID=2044937 RepID=A0A9D5JWI3_9BACT|nr:type II/IV secretion system protein [candidate division KSB3 bacterium]MBD3325207.1 type II/IV secretion system protein [candidate division KSB3 bacterium]
MKKMTIQFVCEVLQQHNLVDQKTIDYITANEAEQRKHLKGQSASNGTNGTSDITAVDVISSMNLKVASDPRRSLSEELIMKTLADHWNLPFLKIDLTKLSPCDLASKVSAPFAKKNLVFPVMLSKRILLVAVVNPTNVEALETIRTASKLKVRPVISTKTDILKAIAECYKTIERKKAEQKSLDDFQAYVDAAESEISQDTSSKSSGFTSINTSVSPDKNIVTAVNLMLNYACEQRANEIHIEPKQFFSQIRFRIDGMLYDVKQIPPEIQTSMLLRFKALAGMDISEKRKPQDGRTQFDFHGRSMTLRISTMPMVFGEKIMIRILDQIMFLRHVEDLGFCPEEFEHYMSLISQSNGIILVAGPPGSGKTTTLYSTLDVLSDKGINITTLEDPVEFPYDRFNQIAIQPGVGFTFETAIRHIVRQSPDVIMLSEIRDKTTADNAIQASLLGHLVVGSLHTHDTSSALIRLVKMGTEPFLVESTVIGVLAQRLLRKICPECKEPYSPTEEEMAALHVSTRDLESLSLWKGTGCLKCRGTGYFGQTGIFELMEMTDDIRALIDHNAGSAAIKEAAQHSGMRPLREHAITKMRQGITSCEEVLRVTGGLRKGEPHKFKTKIALSRSETEEQEVFVPS